jgi:hypothetical protein
LSSQTNPIGGIIKNTKREIHITPKIRSTFSPSLLIPLIKLTELMAKESPAVNKAITKMKNSINSCGIEKSKVSLKKLYQWKTRDEWMNIYLYDENEKNR